MDAKELRNLQEAYSQVYQELDEAETARGPRLIDTYDKPPYSDDAAVAKNPVKMKRKGPKMKGVVSKEEVETDLFNIILEHLVAEGYADTNEAALAIMANMSEEWRENIVEELTGERRKGAEEKLSKYKRNDPRASALIKTIRDKEGSRIGTGKFPTKRGGYGKKGEMKAYSLGGGSDRGEGNKAARRAGKSVQDTRGDED